MVKRIRKMIQAGWGVLTNAYVKGFLPGQLSIYKGPLKRFCVPGMNCYSCPGALGACPIGAMQALFDGRHRRLAFSVIGYLSAIGLIAGRFVCGWLCLFGLIEELLYKIPTPKLRVPEKLDRVLRNMKYVFLAVFVVALPLFFRNDQGMGTPFFCKYFCPVGTLEGGIPLVLLNKEMRLTLGALFRWKFAILAACLLLSVFLYRPFCKYMCPLGAFYSLFQRVSLFRMHLDERACVGCGLCAKVCKMNVNPVKEPNSPECIRCRECIDICPKKALSFAIGERKPEPVEGLENGIQVGAENANG